MPFSRYNRTPIIDGGSQYGTSRAIEAIRAGIASGQIRTKQIVSRGADRLDTLAGELYGDGRLWWVLAASSNMGWGLQVPPGTIITVPQIADISALVG